MQFVPLLISGFALLNLVSFATFGMDKGFAIKGKRRLLTLAALGGSIGAKLAQRMFRHKTSKQPFATILNVIITAQMVGAAVWLYAIS